MASSLIVPVNAANWQSAVLDSPIPILVDFWAEWCAPCRALAPTLDLVAEELKGRLTIAKVNVDESPDLAAQFRVQSIPALLVFKGGKVAAQMAGNQPKAVLVQRLSAVL